MFIAPENVLESGKYYRKTIVKVNGFFYGVKSNFNVLEDIGF
jgi:hypothetical protein